MTTQEIVQILNRAVAGKNMPFSEAHYLVLGDHPDWNNPSLLVEIMNHEATWQSLRWAIKTAMANESLAEEIVYSQEERETIQHINKLLKEEWETDEETKECWPNGPATFERCWGKYYCEGTVSFEDIFEGLERR